MATPCETEPFQKLSDIFEADKTAFLDDVQTSVRSYIIGTGKQCIAIVEKIPTSTPASGDQVQYHLYKHELHLDSDLAEFAQVLIHFIRRKPHDGHDLDSALTEPVLEIIEDKYVKLFESHGEEISSEFLEALKKNNILLNSFLERLADKVSGKIATKIRTKIVHLLVLHIHDAATSNTSRIIGQNISHFAATAMGSQIAAIAAHVLLKSISVNMVHIIAKFLASAAFKKVIVVLLHKLIVGIIMAAVLHFLAANVGAAIGAGTIMFIIVPIVAVIIIKQIVDFPKKLGNEVSESVRAHLASNFGQANNDILAKTFQEIFNDDKLLEAVANDVDVRRMIEKLSEEIVNN